MHNTKLVQLLSALQPEEMSRFSKFVKSPFYNTNPTQVKFYEFLKTAYPTFDQPKLKKERVFQRLYPGKKFNYAVFANLVSGMVSLVEKYLVALQLEENKPTLQKLLIKSYSGLPGCYDFFLKKLGLFEKELDALPYRDADWFREKFILRHLYLNHPQTTKYSIQQANYVEAMENFEQSYALEKMLMSCEMKAREKPLSERYDIWLLEELKSNVLKLGKGHVIFHTYKVMLALLEQPEVDTYFELKRIFLENLEQYSSVQKKNIVQTLINFSIQMGNKEIDEFTQESFEWYKFRIDNQLIAENGVMPEEVFTNIVLTSLKAKQYDWCQDFIHQYAGFLNEKYRKDVEHLGIAFWLYYQSRTDDTIEYLNGIQFVNDNYQIRARLLLLRVYYEVLKEDPTYFDTAESQAKSFGKYLSRNKTIANKRLESYLNYTLIVQRMMALKNSGSTDSAEWSKLKKQVNAEKNIASRKWILSQINER